MLKSRKFSKGIRIKGTTDAATLDGEIRNDKTAKRTKVYHDTDGVDAAGEREVVTEDQTQILTNKTHTSPVINTGVSGTAIDTDAALTADSDTLLASQKAVKAYVDAQILTKDEASEIAYDNSTSGLTAANVQTAVDEVEGRLDTAETSIGNNATAVSDHLADTTDAHDASAISNVATATLLATDVQGALNELDGEIVTNTTNIGTNATSISDHLADAVDAHDASAISFNNVTSGLTAIEAQAALDEIDGNLDSHEAATASVHGVSGFVLGSTDTQDISNKTFVGPVSNEIQSATGAGSVSLTVSKPVIELGGTITKVFGLSFSGNYECKVINRTGSTVTIGNEDTGNVIATTRILTGTGLDIDLLDNQAVAMQYSDTENRWNVIGGTGSATATGGSGGINYLKGDDTNFETSVGNWLDTTGLNITATSGSTVLRGLKTGAIGKSSGDVSGAQAYVDFTIDKADLAKKLTISFDYDASDANLADGAFIVKIIQDPSGTPITILPNGSDIKAGANKTHYAQFQTDHTELDYRLVIEHATTETSSYSLYIDNVSVGPTNLAFGAIQIDPIDYTPTITGGFVLGNGAINNSWYARNGKFLSGRIDITVGTTTTQGALVFTLPPGLQIDPTLDGGVPNYGNVTYFDAGTSFYDGYVFKNTNTQLVAYAKGTSTAALGTIVPSSTIPFTWVSGDVISIVFDNVPIQGWSSNAQMSEDLGGREVVVEGAGSNTTTATANVTDISWIETKDTTSSWNGTQFTVPESGQYLINGHVAHTSAANIQMYIDDVPDKFVGMASDPTNIRKAMVGLFSFVKGQVISFRSNTTMTVTNNITVHWLSIVKLASPQTMLETETVTARYTSNSGQSIPYASYTTIIYEDLDFDTHGAYNPSTGIYTASVSGYYQVNSFIWMTLSGPGSGVISPFKNGAIYQDGDASTSISDEQSCSFSGLVRLEKGDTLDMRLYQASPDTLSKTLNTNSLRNVFTIARIK